ncbi:hypothetical protein EYF80_017028 [Liparis tanakae]|uniref:Uncharacterized protein n=1 Tax=Liparis tanakae TaxID=230148 RepID=A0A4Z2I5Z8_9TELE|nr:hypothetical protein EYF80_017028 [Liparis tanakae]
MNGSLSLGRNPSSCLTQLRETQLRIGTHLSKDETSLLDPSSSVSGRRRRFLVNRRQQLQNSKGAHATLPLLLVHPH